MDGCFEVFAQLVVYALAIVGLVALVQRLQARRGGADGGSNPVEARLDRLEVDLEALRRWAWDLHRRGRRVAGGDEATGAEADRARDHGDASPLAPAEPATAPAAAMTTASATFEAAAFAVGSPAEIDPAAPPADSTPSIEAAAPPTDSLATAAPSAPAGSAPTVEAATPLDPPPDAVPGAAPADSPPAVEPASPPPHRPSIEERLGAHLPVWLGSIALALAGAFLVKYSLDQGWIGPRVRVLLALAMAFVLIGAGERLRRASASIAQGLTAAGVAVLYAALLAAVHLYGLIGPWAGFLLLAATTAGAVGLALRHGQMVALIGLLGGLLTPHLVMLEQPRPGHLFAYLLLLEAGLLAASRRRGWTGVAMTSLAGGFGWTVLAMTGVLGAGSSRGAALFLLGSAALAALVGGGAGGPGRWRGPQAVISGVGTGGALLLLLVLVAQRGYATTEWAFLGLLTAGLLLLARIEERLFPLAAVAAAAVGLLFLAWLGALEPEQLPRYLATVAAFAALLAGGAYAALWRANEPGRWGLLAALAMAVAPLLAFAAADRVGRPLAEGAVCLAVAALAAAAAAPPLLRRSVRPDYAAPGAALAIAAAALLPLAAWYELDGGALTVAWALEVPLLVELSRRWRLPALWTPAVPLAALAMARLVFLPGLHFPAGGWPVVNRLLIDYGLPAAAFAVAAWRARRGGEEDRRLGSLAQPFGAAALVCTFLLVTLEVRHAFHAGDLWAPLAGLAETGWWLSVWLLLGWALAAAAPRLGTGLRGAEAVLAVALAAGFVLHGLRFNPLLSHQAVGSLPVLNLLLWGYGVPLVLLLLIDRAMARQERHQAALAARVGALVAGLLLVTLEVRRAFRGPYLDAPEVGFAEWGGLLAAWLALALLLYAAGRRWTGRGLGTAGAVLAALALVGVAAGPLTTANPLVHEIDVGRLPVVNLLLWVYGVPALLFAALARELARRQEAPETRGETPLVTARIAGWAAAVLGLGLVSLQVRQAFHGAYLDAPTVGFGEWGALVVAWLAAAGLLAFAAARFPDRNLQAMADVLVALALAGLLIGPLLIANPLWSHRAVGSLPVVNLLLWTYGAPALLLAVHAALAERRRRPVLARWTGGPALVLLFVLVTLEVRQAFHGAYLDGGAAGHGEQYAYSAAWVLLATALLVTAITRHGSRALRLASLVVMALAVGKVFLYDTAHLTDLYRVLSFLGLGLSLLLLAWIYQRFVFQRA